MNPENIKSFLSLTVSHLLKVTKIQVEFLIMTEKIVFVYKHTVSLNVSDFSVFFKWNLELPCPWKRSPLFPCKSFLKIGVLSNPSPFFWKYGRMFNPSRKGGCTLCMIKIVQYTNTCWCGSLTDILKEFSVSPRMNSFQIRLIFNKLETVLKILINSVSEVLLFKEALAIKSCYPSLKSGKKLLKNSIFVTIPRLFNPWSDSTLFAQFLVIRTNLLNVVNALL